MGWSDVQAELFDETRQTGRLPLRQVQHEPREGRGVDDRVFERALQTTTDKPRVERVMTVLDQHRALRKAEEGAPRVLELWRADEHGSVDVMPPSRVRIDRRTAVDQRVEEREGALEREALGAELEDQEGGVSRRLDVERDELRVGERRGRAKFRSVDGDLLPGHRLGGAARLEVDGAGRRMRAHGAGTRARRAHLISSRSTARSSSTATA